MMRRFALLFTVISLLLLAVVPAFAQDDMGTIADIVVASTEAETPEFTVLLAAVSAAGLVDILADEEENWTVFAPTDAAFAAALEALGITAEDLLADTELLTDILLYHVVPATFVAEDVVALDGALVGTALYESALAISLDGESVLVNDATVVTPDVMASNGVIHVIDTVLLPPMDDMMMGEMEATEEAEMGDDMMMEVVNIAETVIAATAAETPEFTTLLAAVTAADPSVLAELSNGGPFTVFAPTDAAFGAALEALGITAEDLLADTELLTSILAYHVVPGHFAAETVVAVAGEGVEIATFLAGTTVTVTATDAGVTVNEANVVTTDIHASNGIIHVIDAVLLPPAEDSM